MVPSSKLATRFKLGRLVIMHPFLSIIEKLIVKIKLKSGFHYCTKNPEVSNCALHDDELLDVITESKINVDLSKIISLEISHLPEGSTPLAAKNMTPKQIRETNIKVLSEIEEIKKEAQNYAKEYCSDYETCLRLMLNEDIKKTDLDYYCFLEASPDDNISKSAIIKTCREKWARCIASKKNKAIEMLLNEKKMAEADDDHLASEEIDSLLDLIESSEEETNNALANAESVNQILNYWPALLLPAPALAAHASKQNPENSSDYWSSNQGCLYFSMYDKVFNKNIIFANNNSYLTFEEIDVEQKGFFTFQDFERAQGSTFGKEGIREHFFRIESYKNLKTKLPELSSKMASRITKEDWLNFISEENPYNIASKSELHSCGSDPTTKTKIPWQERLKIKEKETNKIFEDEDVLIVQPLSYKSMVLYGYDTKWCYSSAATEEHYKDVEDSILFFIIFNRPKKGEENHKFLLSVHQKIDKWFFEDQANRLLTDKTIYDAEMNVLEDRSSKHLDFLFKNFSAMEKLQCATYLEPRRN